jgi:excisionase family DNA binding protein
MNNPFESIEARLSCIETLLKDLKQLGTLPCQPTTTTEEILTVQEAADFLHLSVPTLYGKVHSKEVPFSKPGKRLYFSKAELTAWVQSGRQKTAAEVSAEAAKYINSKSGR